MVRQASADLQAKGCVLEREERLIGGFSEGDAVHFKTGDALFPGYTISVVISLKVEQCGKAEQPMFQALVVTTGCNIPNIYVNLQDYHCWVQVPTNSGRLESVATNRDLLHEQMPLTITIVVDGLLVYCYFNENFALEKPKRLSKYALPVKTGEIACGRHPKLIAEKGDTRGDIYMAGAMMLLRLFPRPMVLHEVQSVARASRTVATKILKRRGQKDAPVSAETPVTVRNIIEVTQLVIQFTQVQLSDDLTQQMGKKSKGLQELMDPDTIMWMVLALGTASMYLPHQHPKYLELIKQPFVKTLQMVAGIIEAVISAERRGAGLSPHEQAFVTAASVYVSHILESPRGKNIMVDELAATLIIKMIPFTDRSIDLSEFVIKRCHTLSPRVAILLLNSRQESMATLALVLDAMLSRIVNDDGVIFKEDLQEFLMDKGLAAIIEILNHVGEKLAHLHERMVTSTNKEALHFDKAALDQVQYLADRMLRQLFLQLHHIMDEVIIIIIIIIIIRIISLVPLIPTSD